MNRFIGKLLAWHEARTYSFQKAMRLDDYHMIWFSFMKGFILGMVVFLLLY